MPKPILPHAVYLPAMFKADNEKLCFLVEPQNTPPPT